ncbi:NAD-dependent epimerase/dehydratase family protein [Hymenobacter negativus]|uniref:NAD-dependent epimerase/dehydratase family protein n=1 Tax=Hymenobacter negativus TaxID=2795026 RepID=A0ABS0QDI2_9BACT|nr:MULTISPECIES: NAD-dependent epimerase/dehydratase family protein [Bacteria]MBH8560502.1 NAD-dependent epimerase/dehydratase family protein [Hymenobacter negativus]MBH8570885.1 NAD-dependent epimerase/dehydratase family protein [Hymenobacter negativus]MBR7210622.1 NAD-dependent epimerase/dehydratase family protein [Microvirga sp. STS02]
MAETVLVTGANGFLGRHLVAELRQRGHEVRALLRPGTPAPFPADWHIDYREADLTQPHTMAGAADGCTAIIHAAALARVNPARNPAVWAANVGGTKAVLRLARRAGVRRLVYVGTANVFGFGPKANPGDETRPYSGRRYGLDYMDSKRAATDLVLRAVAQKKLPAVLVHPTFMLGPQDAKPTSNALLLELLRGKLPGYPPGGKNYVHVRDVATATINALTQGRVGESYILGNENLSYREAFGLMAEVLGVPPPRWPVLAGLATLYGEFCDVKAWLSGRPAQLNSAMTAVANDNHYFNVQKARQELALPQTPIRQAVAEAFDWFKANHYV